MSKPRSLLSAWEVVRYSILPSNYPLGQVCNNIPRTERMAFDECFLGYPMYLALLEDMVDISASPYQDTPYDLGSIIIYEGCYLESTKNANTTHPDDDNSGDPDWVEIKKFKTPCYQDVWDLYLKHWLANSVVKSTLELNAFKITPGGVTKIYQDNSGRTSVTLKELQAYKSTLGKIISTDLKLVYDSITQCTGFVETKLEDGLFGCDSNPDDCKKPGKIKRRGRIRYPE